MTETNSFTTSNDAQKITIEISNLGLEQNIETGPVANLEQDLPHRTLDLLSLLTDPDIFAACRNPGSMFIREACFGQKIPTEHEILNLKPLSSTWRQQLSQMGPLSEITFVFRLPQGDGPDNVVPKLFWRGEMGSGPGIFVPTQELVNLAISMASVTRVRVKKDLQFMLVYDESEGIKRQTMENLQRQLNNIANHNPQNIKAVKDAKLKARKDCKVCNGTYTRPVYGPTMK